MERTKSKGWVVNASLLVFSILLSLILCELTFALMNIGSPYISGSGRLYDPILLYRLPANYAPGIDAYGFRNLGKQESSEVLILGDSHAYGYNAGTNENWPSIFERETGLSTYNAGMGGYGAAQYMYLTEKFLEPMKPKLVVVTFFLGNDLIDACYIANRLNYWQRRYTALKLSTEYCGKNIDTSWQENKGRETVLDWISSWIRSTRLGSVLLRKFWEPIRNELVALTFKANVDEIFLRTDAIRTIIPSHYSHGDSHSLQGLEISKKLLMKMNTLIKASGALLGVLVVPSKGSVFYDYMLKTGIPIPEAVLQDILMERSYETSILKFLQDQQIIGANARPALEMAVTNGTGRLYPIGRDDHPTPAGYKVYAKAFLEAVETELNLLKGK